MTTPILMARPDQDVAPHSYVIIRQVSHCRCGSLHEFSTVYAKTHLRSRTGHTYVPNLRPVRNPDEIAYNLPISVENRPVEHLPFCHECFDGISLAHLPTPPQPTKEQIAKTLHGMGIVQHDVKRTRYIDKHGHERYEDTDEPVPPKAAIKAKPFTVDDL